MFDGIKRAVDDTVSAFWEKYDNLTDSASRLNQNFQEMWEVFVKVKNIVFAFFQFLGQETTLLLFSTLLFLLIVDLIPFLFLGKRARYYLGVCFGVCLSVAYCYTPVSLIKYLLVMFFPLILEFVLALFFKTVGKCLWYLSVLLFSFIWESLIILLFKAVDKTRRKSGKNLEIVVCSGKRTDKKNEEDEK